MAQTEPRRLTDITDLNTEDRQKALWAMSSKDMAATLDKLMRDNRYIEQGARLDALTVAILRFLPPYDPYPYPDDSPDGSP